MILIRDRPLGKSEVANARGASVALRPHVALAAPDPLGRASHAVVVSPDLDLPDVDVAREHADQQRPADARLAAMTDLIRSEVIRDLQAMTRAVRQLRALGYSVCLVEPKGQGAGR